MNKNERILIAAGGTGGHVFPGCNLASHLSGNNFKVKLTTDKRGFKFLEKFNYLDISVLPSFPFLKKNIFKTFYSLCLILYSVLRSLIFLIFYRPNIIIGMGGYASFPICAAAIILKKKFVIYENNLIIGKANKYLLPFAYKILVSNHNVEGIPNKYNSKLIEIGNIIKKEFINTAEIKTEKKFEKLKILILGGSQAAKVFGESLPKVIKQCSNYGIPIKIYQQCMPHQLNDIRIFYENAKIENQVFNFNENLAELFSKVNFAITRSGSSILAELTNSNIPFIAVPLPSSADDHQLKNAIYYKSKKFAFLIEEKELIDKLFPFITKVYEDKSILNNVVQNQRQFSDKNVYNNIDRLLKKILDEKN